MSNEKEILNTIMTSELQYKIEIYLIPYKGKQSGS